MRASCVLACTMCSLAIVITNFQSFLFFSVFCFSPTSVNLPCAKICFPQYFGISRRNTKKKKKNQVIFIFLREKLIFACFFGTASIRSQILDQPLVTGVFLSCNWLILGSSCQGQLYFLPKALTHCKKRTFGSIDLYFFLLYCANRNFIFSSSMKEIKESTSHTRIF